MPKAKSTEKPAIRTPIVAVMGHVDHGKTSLLDAIRNARVVDTEEGGITQNTRAHQITTLAGNKITFIDTPGHEAFSAMRSRGAEVTDFVVLVVAADDGVQAQTKESINFAIEAGVPIIVAINKMDAPGAQPDKVKRELASFGVNIEEYGGEAMCFLISALKKEGITELVEGIELLAEVQELKASSIKEGVVGQAYVLESTADKRLGPVALCILKSGEVDAKAMVVTNSDINKVRAFLDQDQKNINKVYESDPFWVTGLSKPLATGDIIYFVADEKSGRALLSELQSEEVPPQEPVVDIVKETPTSILTQMLQQREAVKEGVEQKVLHVVVKASSQGTLEAVKHELKKLGDDERIVNILESATGEVTEGDIRRAKAAGGIVISFQQPLSAQTQKTAKQERVIVRNYGIIYEMMDELGTALDSLIEPPEVEVEIARAKIKKIFELTNGSIVAGSEVIKGTMVKGYNIYVERPRESTATEISEVARGKIKSLKLAKTEAREIKKGQDCGILIDPTPEGLEEGDEIVAFKLEK